MRRRTTALITLAVAAAAAAGIAVPALAAPGDPAPPVALADTAGSGQSVIDWNRQLVAILGTAGAQPATVHPTRSFAMLQAAEYDAVVAITGSGPAYRSTLTAPAGARPDAAADQAAHDVLAALYPGTLSDLHSQLTGELAAIPDGQPKQEGSRWARRPPGSWSPCGPPTARRAPRRPSRPATGRATTGGRRPSSRRRCIPAGAR
jgi:hypothetical protein